MNEKNPLNYGLDQSSDIEALRSKLEKALQDAERMAKQRDGYKAELANIESMVPPSWLYYELLTFLNDALSTSKVRLASAADNMAKIADSPQDAAFKQAVESYRKEKEWYEQCEFMISNLNQVKPKP